MTKLSRADPMACVSTSSPTRRASLVLLTPFANYEFFEPMKKGVQDAAAALGVTAKFGGPPSGDIAALVGQVHAELESGCDGIAINMTQRGAFDAVAAEALRRGVPLISVNVDDPSPTNVRLATVGQNMLAAGETLGKEIASRVVPGSHALLTMHDAGISALEDRAQGVRSALQTLGLRWTTIVTGTEREQAVSRVKTVLDGDSSISLLLGTGQADTEACGLTAERYVTGKKVFVAGFDTGGEIPRLLRSGVLSVVVDQQPYAQGFLAIVNLLLAVRHGISPATIDTGARLLRAKDCQ